MKCFAALHESVYTLRDILHRRTTSLANGV